MSKTKLPLSLVIITLNEASGIARAIESAAFCDDIVVLDSGSTDDTRGISERLGARVFNEEWRGFQKQKQRATDLAKHEWILSLDGDEWLSPELAQEIQSLFASGELSGQRPSGHDGYQVPRLTWNLGRWIRHGGWYPDYQLRLFNRTRAKWGGGEHVHEHVEAKNVVRLKHHLLHEPFTTHAEQVATNNRYSGLGANELARKGKRFRLFRLITKPVSKFFETYVIKGGFLDGLPGFIIAVGAAYSIFLKFAKLWEIEASQNEKWKP